MFFKNSNRLKNMIKFKKIYNESVKELANKNIVAEDDAIIQNEIILDFSLLDKAEKTLNEINIRADAEKYNLDIIDIDKIKNKVVLKGPDQNLIDFLLKTGYCTDINDVQNNFNKLNISGYLQAIDDRNKE